MGRIEALALLTRYYAAFNAGDWVSARWVPPCRFAD